MSPQGMPGRNLEIVGRVLGGETIAAIGAEYGVTPERVRQIVYKHCRKSNPDAFRMVFGEGPGRLDRMRGIAHLFMH